MLAQESEEWCNLGELGPAELRTHPAHPLPTPPPPPPLPAWVRSPALQRKPGHGADCTRSTGHCKADMPAASCAGSCAVSKPCLAAYLLCSGLVH